MSLNDEHEEKRSSDLILQCVVLVHGISVIFLYRVGSLYVIVKDSLCVVNRHSLYLSLKGESEIEVVRWLCDGCAMCYVLFRFGLFILIYACTY